jgi:hypothetical protein
MTPFFVQGGRRFFCQTIIRPVDFVVPFGGETYPCLLWVHTPSFAPEDRYVLADLVTESGCRYAVCAGNECEALHDDIDSAYIQPFTQQDPEAEDRALMMTTWHEGESPDEVAEFFVWNTNFDEHDFRDYLVLHVGGMIQDQEVLNQAVIRAATAAP